MEAAAARVSARFFGFAPESAAPSSAALGAVAVSMVAIAAGADVRDGLLGASTEGRSCRSRSELKRVSAPLEEHRRVLRLRAR